jgi:hypothetical protein
VEQKLEERS